MASYALLKRANLDILEGHLHHCIKESFSEEINTDDKINEVIQLLKRMIQ